MCPLRETREAGEAALIAEMTAILRRKLAADYARGGALREAHQKTVGPLRGCGAALERAPLALRQGGDAAAAEAGVPHREAPRLGRGAVVLAGHAKLAAFGGLNRARI